MPKTKKTKRNLYTMLHKFAVWLNKVEHEPTIAAVFGKKVIKIKRTIDPETNFNVYIKQLMGELTIYIEALTSNMHHEKLAKETKRKLENFDMKLCECWHDTADLPRGSINALNALQKKVQTYNKKVQRFIIKIKAAKKRGMILHIQPPTHLSVENAFKKKQIANKSSSRTHLKILKIATKKNPGS